LRWYVKIPCPVATMRVVSILHLHVDQSSTC
jgi:hypothetical protein